MEDRKWQLIQMLLDAENNGKPMRPMSSRRTLFGIKSNVEEVLDKAAAEMEERNKALRQLQKSLPDIGDSSMTWRLENDGIALVGDGMELRGDFKSMLPRLKQSNLQNELLIKAAKPARMGANPTAIDATAGLGEDSLLLAAAGFYVHMCEYNPITASLLRDALRKASFDPELKQIVTRMQLTEGDSVSLLANLPYPPDLILLDPMFPAKQKSGISKKKLQMLQHLEKPCSNETELFEAALSANPKKIIVKRPLKGPNLAGKKPSYTIKGKTIRYDCYALVQ